MVKKTLVKTWNINDGAVYSVIGPQRFKLADCNVRIEYYIEKKDTPKMLGSTPKYVKRHIYLTVCDTESFTREIDDEYLQNVSSFDLTADIQRPDGQYERLYMNNAELLEVDEDFGTWTFEVKLDNQAKELLIEG
ncbi:MAG: hypothetical protein ACI4W2_12555 [Eubacterium sp.]|jgi:hypothetical protein